jgi:hypothetical protein
MHKDFDSKNVETVNYAKSCPGAAARGQFKRKNEMKNGGMAKPRG